MTNAEKNPTIRPSLVSNLLHKEIEAGTFKNWRHDFHAAELHSTLKMTKKAVDKLVASYD